MILCFCSIACTQKYKNEDEVIFYECINNVKNKNNLFFSTALYFIGTPYGYSTLEINEKEELVVNLRELDCFTYIENSIALYRTMSTGSDSVNFEYLKKELKNIRYRNGKIQGYTSRLHYMTDWIFENEIKRYVFDKTKLIGGVELPTKVYYMSENYGNYVYLKKYPHDVEKIKEIEERINSRDYHYIPKEKIPTIEKKIKTGDIVCFTSKIKGLDVSHLGIASWQEDILTFIHASAKYKKIIVNPESLFDYCIKNKNITGIMVLEVL